MGLLDSNTELTVVQAAIWTVVMSKRFPSRLLQPLPHVEVGRALGVQLAPGGCHVRSHAHEHIAKDHSDVYDLVWQHLDSVVLTPTYAGQSPHHRNNFEVVKRIRIFDPSNPGTLIGEYYVLVPISIKINRYGNYRILSGYTISEEDVMNRRAKNHLVLVRK